MVRDRNGRRSFVASSLHDDMTAASPHFLKTMPLKDCADLSAGQDA
jgi:hypothetical protein